MIISHQVREQINLILILLAHSDNALWQKTVFADLFVIFLIYVTHLQ